MKMTPEQRRLLNEVSAAAARQEESQQQLHVLAVRALERVPATHVAKAAGVSRATLYRLADRVREVVENTEQLSEEQE